MALIELATERPCPGFQESVLTIASDTQSLSPSSLDADSLRHLEGCRRCRDFVGTFRTIRGECSAAGTASTAPAGSHGADAVLERLERSLRTRTERDLAYVATRIARTVLCWDPDVGQRAVAPLSSGSARVTQGLAKEVALLIREWEFWNSANTRRAFDTAASSDDALEKTVYDLAAQTEALDEERTSREQRNSLVRNILDFAYEVAGSDFGAALLAEGWLEWHNGSGEEVGERFRAAAANAFEIQTRASALANLAVHQQMNGALAEALRTNELALRVNQRDVAEWFNAVLWRFMMGSGAKAERYLGRLLRVASPRRIAQGIPISVARAATQELEDSMGFPRVRSQRLLSLLQEAVYLQPQGLESEKLDGESAG